MSTHVWGGIAALLLALASASARADCRDDLTAVDRSFEETPERLEKMKNGTPAQKCPVYRSHVRS